ncbi:MAG: hypothetical protein ACTSSP_00155 [Candidatus Asgardarchaeia archaeon]
MNIKKIIILLIILSININLLGCLPTKQRLTRRRPVKPIPTKLRLAKPRPTRRILLKPMPLFYIMPPLTTGNIFFNINEYYVWAIANDQFNIPVGFIPTEVNLILNGISHVLDDPDCQLDIYLIDNPLVSEVGNSFTTNDGDVIDNIENSSHPARREIIPLKPTLIYSYTDNAPGLENISFNINQTNDPNSWFFNNSTISGPIDMQLSDSSTTTMNSKLLEFIDFAGSGESLGLLFDPEGVNSFTINELSIEIKIETYVGEYTSITQRISAWPDNNPPFTF